MKENIMSSRKLLIIFKKIHYFTYDIIAIVDASHTLQVLSPEADIILVPSGFQDTWNEI